MDSPLSPWIAVAAVVVASGLLCAHGSRRWAPASNAAALTGLTAIFAAFLVIGSVFDCALHKPEWLDPPGLWSSILAAFVMTTLGIIVATPWVMKQAAVEGQPRATT